MPIQVNAPPRRHAQDGTLETTMPHTSIYSLTERLVALEELQRLHAGETAPLQVCGICAAEYDTKGCYCGKENWLPLPAAITAFQVAIDSLRNAERLDAGS